MSLLKTTSTYVGKCFRGKKDSAFLVQEVLMRQANKTKIAVIQCLHTKEIKVVSIRSIYRAYQDGRMMIGYTWFFCGYCRGSGTNERGNDDCPRCKGSAVLWVDTGYNGDDIKLSRVRKPPRKKIEFEEILPPRPD